MNVLQDGARSLGKFRSVRNRTKREIPSKEMFHNENHDTSKQEYDFWTFRW